MQHTPVALGRGRSLGIVEPAERRAPQVARSRLARAGWVAAGSACVGIGSVAMVIPGLPTTVFFVAAAWCFARSNPRFERWVLDLPGVGPLVRDVRAGLGMPRRAKRAATVMIWLAITISALTLRDVPWLAALIVLLGAVGTVYIWRFVPTHPGAAARE